MPVGYKGLRLGINASDLHYTVIEDNFSAVQAQGGFRAVGLEASYPVVRQRDQALSINSSFQHKNFENFSDSTLSSQYSSRVLNLGVQGFRANPNQPNSNLSGNLSISTGILDAQTPDAPSSRFEKLNYSILKNTPLGQHWQLKAELQGQHSKDGLDSSEKFYLGGALGVRAYPSNEGSASNGKMLSLELTKTLRSNLLLAGFYDWGKLKPKSSEAAISSAYILKGTGLRLQWQASARCQIEGILAHRIGNNPNPTSTGSDQDGTRDNTRLWVRSSFRF
jgi:hemolysin activation/secretion protein